MPLKSKQVSSNWEKECSSLENVLNSIFYQKKSNIEPIVYLSCHETPLFLKNYLYKKNIILIDNMYLPIPNTIQEKNLDKQTKKQNAIREISKHAVENDFLAIFDADDLCHSDLFNDIEFKSSTTNFTDFVFHTGYMFNIDTKDFSYIDGVNNIFYKICGSCIISKISTEDIKTELNFFLKLTNHTKFFEICETNSRKPCKYTFPAMLYMHNSINNLSSGNIYLRKIFQERKVDNKIHYLNLLKYYYHYEVIQNNVDLIDKIIDTSKSTILIKTSS